MLLLRQSSIQIMIDMRLMVRFFEDKQSQRFGSFNKLYGKCFALHTWNIDVIAVVLTNFETESGAVHHYCVWLNVDYLFVALDFYTYYDI